MKSCFVVNVLKMNDYSNLLVPIFLVDGDVKRDVKAGRFHLRKFLIDIFSIIKYQAKFPMTK